MLAASSLFIYLLYFAPWGRFLFCLPSPPTAVCVSAFAVAPARRKGRPSSTQTHVIRRSSGRRLGTGRTRTGHCTREDVCGPYCPIYVPCRHFSRDALRRQLLTGCCYKERNRKGRQINRLEGRARFELTTFRCATDMLPEAPPAHVTPPPARGSF